MTQYIFSQPSLIYTDSAIFLPTQDYSQAILSR